MTPKRSDSDEVLRLLSALLFVAATVLLVAWLEYDSSKARVVMAVCLAASVVAWIGIPQDRPEEPPEKPTRKAPSSTPRVSIMVLGFVLWCGLMGPLGYLCLANLSGSVEWVAAIAVACISGFAIGALFLYAVMNGYTKR